MTGGLPCDKLDRKLAREVTDVRQVGVFEAKNKLTALLDEVEAGGEVVITRRGRPIARIAPFDVGFRRLTA